MTTAAHQLIDTLLSWGVREIFMCPGSTEAPFLDATLEHPELRLWNTTHEVTAVAMADGYARATGKPGVVFLHASVGLANGVGGIYTAMTGRVPLLVLSGLKSTTIQSRHGFTAPPHVSDLVRAVAKWEWQSLASEQIAPDAARALQAATTLPCGPAWLGLPEDLLAGAAGPALDTGPARRAVRPAVASDADIARAAEMLAGAERPVLVAGNDIARESGTADLLELSRLLGAPVLHEERRSFERTVVPTTTAGYAGFYSPRSPLVAAADVIAFLGARCFHEFEARLDLAPPEHASTIHTSSDPSELAKTYGADLALAGHQGDMLVRLRDRVADLVPRARPLPDVRVEPLEHTVLAGPDTGRLTVTEVGTALGRHVDPVDTLVVDATTSNAVIASTVPQTRQDQLLTMSSGALGWGVGAALGVQLGRSEGRVWCVLGDGSFQFGIQGLAIATRSQLPVTFLVVNNESFAAVAAGLHRFGGRAAASGDYPGRDIRGTDIAQVARGFGIDATRVSTAAELEAALATSSSTGGPYLIEAMTDPRDLGPA